MRKSIVAVALAAAFLVPVVARAHGGHVHKVMGTVSARAEKQVEVKTTDGKTVTIVLNDKTTVLRGKEKLALASVQKGERVVIDVGDGKEPMTAREIKLGETAAAATK